MKIRFCSRMSSLLAALLMKNPFWFLLLAAPDENSLFPFFWGFLDFWQRLMRINCFSRSSSLLAAPLMTFLRLSWQFTIVWLCLGASLCFSIFWGSSQNSLFCFTVFWRLPQFTLCCQKNVKKMWKLQRSGVWAGDKNNERKCDLGLGPNKIVKWNTISWKNSELLQRHQRIVETNFEFEQISPKTGRNSVFGQTAVEWWLSH